MRVMDLWDVARVAAGKSDGEVAALAAEARRAMRRVLDELEAEAGDLVVEVVRELAEDAIQDVVARVKKRRKAGPPPLMSRVDAIKAAEREVRRPRRREAP